MPRKLGYRLFAVLFLAVLALCLALVIKPGASIFYRQMAIDNKAVKLDSGYAYRYHASINPRLFRTKDMLLFEDKLALTPTNGSNVIETGNGSFSFSDPSLEDVFVYFSTSDHSNPTTNGRVYKMYLPYRFISRSSGIASTLILLSAGMWFLYFAFANPIRRKAVSRSPLGILAALDQSLEDLYYKGRAAIQPKEQKVKFEAIFWRRLFIATTLTSFLYVLMEWVFFVTKPSFMSQMGIAEKIEILLLAGLFVSIAGMICVFIYIGISLLMSVINRASLAHTLGALIPGALLSALVLLLVDNFTYTVFKFGISTSTGIWRGVYAEFYLILFIVIVNRVLKLLNRTGKDSTGGAEKKRLFFFSIGLLIISGILALTDFDYSKLSPTYGSTETQKTGQLPNIILLGSDGVNADNMSVYGYERDTTPRLRELAETSLIAENAFTNSSNSAGSIISILTGKLPTRTRVVYAPDILRGTDAYEHLPGLLKQEGYSTVEYGVQDYVDAYSFNMQHGFDSVNGQSEEQGKMARYVRALGYNNAAYFIGDLTSRITERLEHIFFVRNMQNPYTSVTQPTNSSNDEEKINQLLETIEQTPGPLFAHVHLMGTHGSLFYPPVRQFSKGEEQGDAWMVDFYDDAILAFDAHVGEVIDRLKADGEYENTLLIIYSDHPEKYWVNRRVPLMLHFPQNQNAGRISQNVQNLDIAPTILDYLGIDRPAWMNGASMLDQKQDIRRSIFSTGTADMAQVEQGIFKLDPEKVKPPFFQFSFVNLLDCQRWYQLDTSALKWTSGDIPNYVNPCHEEDLLNMDEIVEQVKERLSADGFDVSSLP